MRGRKLTEAGKVVREVCAKFSDTPTISIAKKLLNDYPEMFFTLTQARGLVRYARGEDGHKIQRNKDPIGRSTPASLNPFKLPEPVKNEWTPFILDGVTKLGILADLHIPYHDITAVTTALQHLKKVNPDTILINGDLIDFYMVSRFNKDPRARNVAQEIKDVQQFLSVLRSNFKKQRIIFKFGNHDDRLYLYLRVKAPELLDMECLALEEVLELDKYGITEVIKEGRIIHAGELNIIHGHEYRTPMLAPVNAARGLFLKAKSSTLQAHCHSTSEHTEVGIRGDIITTWSMGCLADLKPEYARLNKYNHGVVDVEFHKNTFEVHNHRIIGNKVV